MNQIGNNLKRIRLLKNLSLKEAGNLLSMSSTAVNKYEKGILNVDSTKLIQFSNAYNVSPFEFLKKEYEKKINLTSFRKRKRLTGQNLELLKDEIDRKINEYFEVLELNSLEKIQVQLKKYSCFSLEDAEINADEFRKDNQLSLKQPIFDLMNTLENLGIVIIEIDNINNKFNDFDGASEIIDGIPFIILLKNTSDGARQRFTIAHELGHMVLDIKGNQMNGEKACDRFASSLLMPSLAVINEFGKSRSSLNFYELNAFKNEYKVSYSSIIYRLKDLNIISEYLYKKWMIIINKTIGKEDKKPIPTENSFQYKKLVHKLKSENIISISKACELLGVLENDYYEEDNRY